MALKIALVWNPTKTTREELETALASAERDAAETVSAEWFETSPDDPGRAAAEAALESGADVVVAAGGDGTVRAVAEVLAERETTADLAIAPLGTGNLLARNLEVPIDDLSAAFGRALSGAPRSIDAGWVAIDGGEKQAFAVIVGFGIDAHMMTETDEDLKSKVGWLAYLASAGKAVSASEVIDVRIGIDGAEPESRKAHTLMVGNCGTVQGGLTLLPDADPADGTLDLLVVDAEGIGGWADTVRNLLWDNGLKRVLPGAVAERAEDGDAIAHERGTAIRIELGEPREIELDGDVVGKARLLEIEVQPGALRVR